ncbi:hypothetical protein T492DRAFT_900644 [Pavlovales sp. CCMP2436]|nr:hypothetical protein T492DRAFT_900644 [Pavlovales sp. CCMP2436]
MSRVHGQALLGGQPRVGAAKPRSTLGGEHRLTAHSAISSAHSRTLVAEYKQARQGARTRRSPDEYVSMGQAYLTSGYAEPAVRCFTSALLEAGPRVDALYGRGNAYELMEMHEAAVTDYAAASKLEPLTPQLYKSRGNALLAMDRYEEAMVAYRHAMAISDMDDDLDAKEAYGRCLFELCEHEASERVLSEVIAFDRGRTVSLMYRGCARMELRGPDDPDAESDFVTAHALDPTLPTQMRQRAQRELRAGNAEQAAQTLSRCIRLDKNNPVVLFERARCWIRCLPPDVPRALADMSECARRLKAAQSGFGDNDALIGCLRGKADLLLERNRPAEAGVVFDELVGMYQPDELPRGVVVGRLRATHALHDKRVFDEGGSPTDWTSDELARATLDSDTLCDFYLGPSDPAAVEFLLKELESTTNAHYIRANLLARMFWAKPIGTRRDEAMRAALEEFGRAHRSGFNVARNGAGRPGVLVTTAWSLGAAEPEWYEPPPRPPASLAKLALVALAGAGARLSGVGDAAPSSAHAALATLLAREALPRAAGEPRPSTETASAMVAHVLAQRRSEGVAFDRARWSGTLLSASAILVAAANRGSLPDVGKLPAPAAKGAPMQRPEARSLAAHCLHAIGRTLPKDLAAPFELPLGDGKVVRDSDEAMASFRVLYSALGPPSEEDTKKAAKKK